MLMSNNINYDLDLMKIAAPDVGSLAYEGASTEKIE